MRLTVAERDGAGVEGGVGARARLKLRGRTIGFDREARAAVQGVFGNGEVYVARDDREADEILRALGDGGPRLGAIEPVTWGAAERDASSRAASAGSRGIGLGDDVAGGSLDGCRRRSSAGGATSAAATSRSR